MSKFETHSSIEDYRSGSCRNSEPGIVKSHTYATIEGDDSLYPMCGYGWNRSDGDRYSIFRGSFGTEGNCKQCQKNLREGKPPVIGGWSHKTKWL